MTSSYYEGKQGRLQDLFGATEVKTLPGGLEVDGRFLPVLDDVIVALGTARLPPAVRSRLGQAPDTDSSPARFAAEIQESFGDEWTRFPTILSEHEEEFRAYFDLLPLDALGDLRIADLGCGIGRWSFFLADWCREIVLVDFSEAIFVARKNLADADNAVFILADVLDLPFRDDAFDLVVCLGVLHHLPIDALDALRQLARLAPRHLAYVYYALDNRPAYFRWCLAAVTSARDALARVHSSRARAALSWLLALLLYTPAARAGPLLRRAHLDRFVPLVETYAGKSFERLRQDAHDRFFTGIEQRFTRDEVRQITDTFESVTFSEGLPYWHFLCEMPVK